MNKFGPIFLLLLCLALLLSRGAFAQEGAQDFATWLELLRVDARSAGISEKTLNEALANLKEPEPRVIERDKTQPEKTESLESYVAKTLTVPADSSIELAGTSKLVLEATDKIQVLASAASDIEFFASYLEITD